jgi:AcrR family transcriptional regulator
MIAEGGAESVTMRGLGRRLDVSRAAAYRHFESKADLLVAVAAAGFSELEARLDAADAADEGEDGAGIERFRRMGEEYVRFALENPARYRLMYGRDGLTRKDHPELREAGNALFERLVDMIGVYQGRGVIRRRDPRAQAYVAWSAVHGLASLLIDGQIMATVDVDELIEQTTRIVLDGMRARDREE